MLTMRTDDTSIHAKRYPEEVKELAYQLWAFVAGRDAKKTHALLATGEYGDVADVSYQAVAYWAREYSWGDRAARDVQAIAPDLRHQAFSELLFAGLEGAKYLRQVIVGSVEADKVRTQASIAAVDRIGFSPVGKGIPGVELPRGEDDTPLLESLIGKSPDELMRLEVAAKSRKR